MVMRKLSKRDGRPWAIIGIEDMDSSIECLMFSDAYEKYGEYLQEDAVILMEGHISIRDEEESATVIVQKVVPLKDAPEHYASHLHVPIYQDKVNSQDLTNLQELLRREPGETEVILSCVLDNNKVAFVQTGASFKVSPKKELVDDICQWAGKDKLIIKPNRKVADRESRRRFYPKKDQD